MKRMIILISLLCIGSAEAQNKSKDDLILERLENLQQTIDKMYLGLKKDINAIDKRVSDLEKDLSELKSGKKAISQQKSGYGTVRIRSTYHSPVIAYVNGNGYYINTNETRDIQNVPAGTFSYKVSGVTTTEVHRTLAVDEIFTITIFTRCR